MRKYLSLSLILTALAAPHGAGAALANDRLTTGDTSPAAATLVAGKRGATYELRGGASVTFSADSEFAFDPSMRLKIRKPGDPETLARVVRLLRGRAEVTIPASLREPTAVLLRGPGKMSAVAKEGRSTFVVDGEQTTAASREGEMLVGIGNDWKPLHEGLARTLALDDPTAVPRPMLVAPTVTASPSLVVSGGQGATHPVVSWPALKDATTYEVTVNRVADGATTMVSRMVATSASATLGALAPGAYTASVVAVDRRGLPGAASEARSIRVVGIEAPEGAELGTDGAVLLGRDQRVTLVGSKGLEVSYGGSSEFGSAPSSLGLTRGEATTARLRAPGSSDETIVRLAPRGLRAKIQIGPHVARWPLDQVVVQIDLYDASGRPVPDDAVVETSVTVNLDPVTPQWERKGKTLRATLSSGTNPGPWVVRAEVRDARGDLIGRDFLEVAQSSPTAAALAKR